MMHEGVMIYRAKNDDGGKHANHYDLGVIITEFGPSLRHYA